MSFPFLVVRKPPESGLLHPPGTRTPCKNVFDKKQTNKEGRKIMSKLYSLSAMVSNGENAGFQLRMKWEYEMESLTYVPSEEHNWRGWSLVNTWFIDDQALFPDTWISNKYLSPISSQKTYWSELWSNSPLFALLPCKYSSIQNPEKICLQVTIPFFPKFQCFCYSQMTSILSN